MTNLRTATQSMPSTGKVPQMFGLLDELFAVVGTENRVLLSGMPASLAQTVRRKTELANQLDEWLEVMRRGELSDELADPEDLALLIERLQELREVMGENSRQIKQSMEASRRRIDAIMRSLRDEPGQTGSYGGVLRRRTEPDAPGGRLA